MVGHLDYGPIKSMSLTALLLRELVEIPFSTALSEELLFRQYLFEGYQDERWSLALLRNSAIFTLWHLIVVLRTVLDTNLAQNPFLIIPSYLGGLLSVLVGGLLFGWLRLKTERFWYSSLTHWLNDALMTLVIWLV